MGISNSWACFSTQPHAQAVSPDAAFGFLAAGLGLADGPSPEQAFVENRAMMLRVRRFVIVKEAGMPSIPLASKLTTATREPTWSGSDDGNFDEGCGASTDEELDRSAKGASGQPALGSGKGIGKGKSESRSRIRASAAAARAKAATADAYATGGDYEAAAVVPVAAGSRFRRRGGKGARG